MKHIQDYGLFESAEPFKQLKEISVRKTDNPDFVVFITVDKTNRIVDIRNPRGVRHYMRLGNILNTRQLENWMKTNGFEMDSERQIKKQLKGNELIKFMMKRGFR